MTLTSDSFSGKVQLEYQEEMLLVDSSKKKLTIGIPKEDIKNEKRIAFTPNTVRFLTDNGITVNIEADAGLASGFSDMEYSDSGASIFNEQKLIFNSDVIVKISPPTQEQITFLKKNQVLISSLNVKTLEKSFFEQLSKKKVTAIALEYIKDEFGAYPFVYFMSEIAGRVAINIASNYLMEKKGKLLGGIGGHKPSEVIIIGAGDIARAAVKTAIESGALVKVFDNSVSRLKELEEHFTDKIYTSIITPSVLSREFLRADVVIGALSTQDKYYKFIVSEELINSMKKDAIVIDLSIDQGACFETSELTSFNEPIIVKNRIAHYGIPNVPSTVPRTASNVLGNVFLQQFSSFQNYGNINHFLKNDSNFRNGLYFYNGVLVNKYIGEVFDLPSQDINLIMAAF